ncbi:MAG TPA: AsmA family protein [Stellaceae bacterium]|nr:AsmA family protein [Stellaceae bacterium]
MRLRAVVFSILVFAVVLVVAVAGALWLGGGPALAWLLEHPLSAAMGRQIRIGGPLTVQWGSTTRIVAEDLHVANASWGSAPEMLAAKRVEIDVVTGSVLWGPTRVPLVALDGATLLLETSKQGEKNWRIAAAAATPKKRGEFPELQKATVSQGKLTYRNGETEATSVLDVKGMEFAAPDAGGPVGIKLDGRFQRLPLRLAASGGPVADLRAPEKPYPIKLDGTLGETHVASDGTVAEPLDVNGLDLNFSLEGRKLQQIADALGLPFPALPDFRGTSKLRGGNGHWKLDALTLALGKSDLEGGVEADTTGKVPYLKAELTARQIDLADFKGLYGDKPAHSSDAAPAAKPEGRLLPDTPLNVGKLPGANIDLAFDGTRVTPISGAPIDRLSLGLHIKDGALTLDPLRFQVARGAVDLKARYTPFTKEAAPRLNAELDVQHVDLRELLRNSTSETAKQTAGIVGGFLKIDSNGNSLHQLASGASGDVGLFMENGQISQLLEALAPLDVLKALGIYVSGDKPTPIDCVILRLGVDKGVAAAQTFLVSTTDAVVQGSGSVNLADETLNLTLKPLNKHFTFFSLRAPIDVTGTLAKPDYNVHAGVAIARLGAAVVFPPAALLTLVDKGLGERNACGEAYAAQQPKGEPQPKPPGR